MVKICSDEYPTDQDEKYATYFNSFPYPLSPFQKHALEAIIEGHHVLVTAHTGSGKTLPAEFAIQHFTSLGKKVIYTSPIKALSNQKYYEFTKKYPEISFGLLTGDIKTNPDADVLIMTTEILMNYLFVCNKDASASNQEGLQFQIDVQKDLRCVVFDEVHYINDKERGQVWEKTILMLPPHIQMVMLSATIDNPAGFAEWCERGQTDKQVYLASTNHRVVPLSHYGFLTTTEAIFKVVRDKATQHYIRNTTNKLIPLQDHKGGFQDSDYRNIVKVRELLDNNYVDMKRKNVLNQLSLFLRDHDMLPAIAFVFSRKHVELSAKDITVPLLEDDSKVGYTVRRECEQIVRKLPNYQEYLQLPEYNQVVSLLEKGIGIHHSGMIPILREIVELMISKKYIKLLFATESFAIGLDCPIRTAIFTSLTKFDGNGERYLMAHEYTQMAGRAGRRGIDTVGHVVHCNNLFNVPTLNDYKTMLGGVPQKLVSKFHISYGLILNLLKNGQTSSFHKFSEKSMITQEIAKAINADKTEIDELTNKLNKKMDTITMSKTPKEVCDRYIELETVYKHVVNKKRKETEREMEKMRNENRTLLEDVKKVNELRDMDMEYHKIKESIEYMEQYLFSQTKNICKILVDDGFINHLGDEIYDLTALGNIAANIAEVHPLPISKKMCDSAYFADFGPKQLVGLFSCFTDVKIPSDQRYSIPITEDKQLKQMIHDMVGFYKNYESIENGLDLRTGIKYESALIFDMVDYSMNWCDCQTEEECKYFIQCVISEKEISIGDFTKAMMKIVTVAKELMNVCETLGAIDLMYKLNQIEGMVLKYVLTSQSLYV
uniref:Helicase ATP-binding domain-containing protein n=1 Tax=viral metagenome TaxID=1070528 RepID=A0A6C0LAP1_9ZZZZ